MTLTTHLTKLLEQHQLSQKQFVVAISGGIDSMVLLHALIDCGVSREQIHAVHIHHGLSQFAEQWLAFCQQQCQQYAIRFSAQRVNLTDFGKGVEAAARDARYNALAQFVTNGEVLLTAQHQDDQCETLLLALKRGSGVRGLAAMPTFTPFAKGVLFRPLLLVARAEVEAYAHAHQLDWVEDDSNSDSRFDRNFLRQQVLPQLSERWPSFSANVARSAALCQESDQLLTQIAQEDFSVVKMSDDSLNTTRLAELSDARINNVLRFWLSLFVNELPSRAVLAQVTTQMLNAKNDSTPSVVINGISVRRYLDAIFVVPALPAVVPNTYSWVFAKPLHLPHGLGALSYQFVQTGVRQPTESEAVSVAFGLSGSFKGWPAQRDKRRSIKKLMQEYRVPTWQRSSIPFVFYDDILVAAVGLWNEREMLAQNEEQAIEFTLAQH